MFSYTLDEMTFYILSLAFCLLSLVSYCCTIISFSCKIPSDSYKKSINESWLASFFVYKDIKNHCFNIVNRSFS